MKRLYFLSLFPWVVLAGCGGSGGSTLDAATPVFLTDDPNPNFDSVVVTVEEVSVTRGGQPVGGIVAGTGRVIHRDLAALHDADGALFSYLGDSGVTVREGDKIHVVFSDAVQVHVVGADAATDAKIVGGVGGKKGYDYYASRKGIQEKGIKIACDLSKWSLSGTDLTIPDAFAIESSATGVRHPREAVSGAATGRRTYTGGRFALEVDGATILGTPTTSVVNADGSASPYVAAGAPFHATGTYSDMSGRFVADTIAIDASATTNAFFFGKVLKATDAGGGFTVGVPAATPAGKLFVRFQPDQRLGAAYEGGIPVDPKTLLAEIAPGDDAQGAGDYDPKTNVLTVRYVRRATGAPTPLVARQKLKTKSNIKNDFVFSPSSWYGFDFTPGSELRLTPTAGTDYELGGAAVSRAQFLESLQPGDTVEWTFAPSAGRTAGYDLKKGTKA